MSRPGDTREREDRITIAEPIETSQDSLYDYYIDERDDGGCDVLVVGPMSDGHDGALALEGFGSWSEALVWVRDHGRSSDLGSFALLRATRTLYAWARATGRLFSSHQAEALAEYGGSLRE